MDPLKQRIVLLGPPASGKGTQADRLSKTFGIPHVSTGALLRSECARETVLGREADEWTSKGLLVPDELAVRIIATWMQEHGAVFLFDGFPRTVGQAEHL
ncbi:MAG: adenylate kinase family protein, partial [Chthoniobacterales bacterium]